MSGLRLAKAGERNRKRDKRKKTEGSCGGKKEMEKETFPSVYSDVKGRGCSEHFKTSVFTHCIDFPTSSSLFDCSCVGLPPPCWM